MAKFLEQGASASNTYGKCPQILRSAFLIWTMIKAKQIHLLCKIRQPKMDHSEIYVKELSLQFWATMEGLHLNLGTWQGLWVFRRENKDESLQRNDESKQSKHRFLSDLLDTYILGFRLLFFSCFLELLVYRRSIEFLQCLFASQSNSALHFYGFSWFDFPL